MLALELYNKECKDTLGGIKEFYISPYKKWTRSQISVLDMDLVSIPTDSFYTYKCVGTYTQDSNLENGAVYFNQNIEIKLPKVYGLINGLTFTKQLYRIIVKTNNNQYIIFGTYNGLEAKLNNASGSGKNEFNGFTLSFTGKEKDTGYLITNLEDANIILLDSEYLTDLLNNDLDTDL